MIYLIVDTNNWIYLANSKNPDTGNFEDGRHIKLFDALMEKINASEVELLVCPVIEVEWQRNKAQAEELIRKYRNEAEGHKGVVDKMAKSLDETDQQSLHELHVKHLAKTEAKIKENQEHILRIKELIQKSTKYNISQETKAFAADWAVEKKAPFIGDKKNSMADAYIFFGAIAHLKGMAKMETPWDDIKYEYPTSIFVSGNKGDFSNQENVDVIHSDLKPIADEAQLNFYRSLPAALNFIQEHIASLPPVFSEEELKEIEQEIDNASDEWYICDVCSPSEGNQYTNMVYFSESYEAEVEDREFVDPNQLQIEFTNIPKVETTDYHKIMIRTGDCTRCGTTHLLCQECNTITPIEGENEDGFECEGCGINYAVRKIHEGKGIYHQEIFLTNK